MLLVGLTGGIGSGKSTVARMLADRGAVVFDSDVLAREAIARGTPGFDRVVELFGPGFLGPEGDLDRAKVAELVFHDDELRAKLERIVHPEVRRRIAEGVQQHAGTERVVVVDSPLLYETGAQEMFEVIVVVSTDPATQLARMMTDRGMDEDDVRARIAAQMPLDQKAKAADVILDNEGTLEQLEGQVDRLWQDLAARASAW